jgi:polygalacturonase
VIISDCHIEAGDDCIVLKTTDRGAPAQPTENVVVTNCVLVSAASALKLGTESNADFRHCVFSNCVIRDSRTGIALMAKDGGTMEAIEFSHITITTKPKWGRGQEWPIHIDSEKRTVDSKVSHIRDVSLSDITIHSHGRIIAQGQAGAPIDGLTFSNVTLRITGTEDIAGAHKISGGSRSNDAVLDLGDKPAAFIFGCIKGLALQGVRVLWPEAALTPVRHAAYGFELDGADFRGLSGPASDARAPRIVTEKSRGVLV